MARKLIAVKPGSREVDRITVTLEVKNGTGTVHVTDIALTAGTVAPLWHPHAAEAPWTQEG